jgi:hypothetical protein
LCVSWLRYGSVARCELRFGGENFEPQPRHAILDLCDNALASLNIHKMRPIIFTPQNFEEPEIFQMSDF